MSARTKLRDDPMRGHVLSQRRPVFMRELGRNGLAALEPFAKAGHGSGTMSRSK